MCLAVPGKILSIYYNETVPMGEVDFSGVQKTVCLVYTPEASIGSYVIVHVGFSITILNEKQAQATLDLLERAPHEICK
jgi:hydrogenase expression/formation protein HypC